MTRETLSVVDESQPDRAGRRTTTTQSVHQQLREMILRGELPAGTVISQVALGELLDVGRTPLREAIRLLESEGLIDEGRPNQMVSISSLSMTDLDDLYSMRVLGESMGIWMSVPSMRKADFDYMAAELEIMETSESRAEIDTAHMNFHRHLRTAASSRMTHHLDELFAHSTRYQLRYVRDPMDDTASQELMRQKQLEHRAVLEACVRRDTTSARDLLIDHIAGTAVDLMLSERHSPFLLPAAVSMAKSPL